MKAGPTAETSAPVVAVAGGRAFTFRYAETDELLRAAGCRPVEFDPLTDPALPPGTAGLYLGGGFPEVHAAELSANTALRADIAGAIAAGLPTVAECAGLLYLCDTVDGVPMVGAVRGDAAMTGRLTLGYRSAIAERDNLLAAAGTRVHGHEFHRTVITGTGSATASAGDTATSADGPAWLLAPTVAPETVHTTAPAPNPTSRESAVLRAPSSPREVPLVRAKSGQRAAGAVADGVAGESLHASYLHVHWAGHPDLATRFAEAAHTFARSGSRWQPAAVATADPEPDLDHHGDSELAEGLVDLAVNVRVTRPPQWLADTIAATVADLAAYPNPSAASRAIAAAHPYPSSSPKTVRKPQRHAGGDCGLRTVFGGAEHVLPTAGAAEAFTLIARAFSPKHPVVIHPQFTEPEAALRAAGHAVRRLLLSADEGFTLDPARVPQDADLVVIGNPTNPTSVLHPRVTVRALARPGRILVVDEAFMDAVPGEPETLLDGGPLDGVLVLRSLTKTWGVAGLRAGYVVGDPALVAQLRAQQPPWSTSAPALAVIEATLTPQARALAADAAIELTGWREHLVAGLTELGLPVVADPRGPFVLVDAHACEQVPGWLRTSLRERGFAVRRCDTFPGLDAGWLRIAVREPATSESLLKTLRAVLTPERLRQ